jgi:uncharacterized lipoprotein YddW (UPF0748 family)
MKIKVLLCLGFVFFLCITPLRAQEDKALNCGLFVSVIENPVVLSNRAEITKLIEFAKKAHIDTLFVQMYRANKTWFPSEVGDDSPYKNARASVQEDPFCLLIKQAHAAGIEVHAWLNLLSLSTNADAKILKKYGPEILTKNVKEKKTLEDYKIDNQYFLEPGDVRVRVELLTMVGELLRNYPQLDGVEFDYIRYPDKDPWYGHTPMNIERFKKATGITIVREENPRWKDWKRQQFTELLAQLVKKTHTLRPDIHVSTTGCAPYSRAYHEAFQDWPMWINSGLVDFVTLMNYPPDVATFEKYIAGVKSKVIDFKKVNIGIGAYKLVTAPEIFSKQYAVARHAGGRENVVFYYGSLRENPALAHFLLSNAARE